MSLRLGFLCILTGVLPARPPLGCPPPQGLLSLSVWREALLPEGLGRPVPLASTASGHSLPGNGETEAKSHGSCCRLPTVNSGGTSSVTPAAESGAARRPAGFAATDGRGPSHPCARGPHGGGGWGGSFSGPHLPRGCLGAPRCRFHRPDASSTLSAPTSGPTFQMFSFAKIYFRAWQGFRGRAGHPPHPRCLRTHTGRSTGSPAAPHTQASPQPVPGP